jgi:hypothetical protein
VLPPKPHWQRTASTTAPESFVERTLRDADRVRVGTDGPFRFLAQVLMRPEVLRTGYWVEFGVFRGDSLRLLAAHHGEARVYGFDSFKGLPSAWKPGFPEGHFALPDEEIPQVPDAIILKGLFTETFEALETVYRKELRPVTFAHIDSDIYESARDALEWLMDGRLVAGSIILFDEICGYPGFEKHEMRALEEAVARGLRLECIASSQDKAAFRVRG